MRNITTITLHGVVNALDLSKETVQKNMWTSVMAGNFGRIAMLLKPCVHFYMSLDFDEEDIPILMVDQDELNRVNRLYEPSSDKPKPDG